MATPASHSVSNLRPNPTGASSAPRAPNRSLSTPTSSFSSPSALRAEEDILVLDIGTRCLRVGFAGDAVPKAVIPFGPNESRRAGDYRQYTRGYEKDWRQRVGNKQWGEQWELWRPDTRGIDLGLVGDRIARAMREAVPKYLITSSAPRRLLLILPPSFPLPLLSATLETLFSSFSPPSILITSAPVLSTISAGLRSAFVIDIGWAETTATAVYEFREVSSTRTVRASKRLCIETLKTLAGYIRKKSDQGDTPTHKLVSFEECEEVMMRTAWCKPTPGPSNSPLSSEYGEFAEMEKLGLWDRRKTDSVMLRSTQPPMKLDIPFSDWAEPLEFAFFAKGIEEQELDDEELPLHLLVYRCLLRLPVDVRSTVMSRIAFTGGASAIPGLKTRVMAEVQRLLDEGGWDPVQGQAYMKLKSRKRNRTEVTATPPSPTESEKGGYHDTTATPAREQPQVPDPIESHIKREKNKMSQPSLHGGLRAVESMGAWAGGSLVGQLKLPTVSVVEKEQWYHHGIQGAGKHRDVVTAKNRQSIPVGGRKQEEQSGWTLGPWA